MNKQFLRVLFFLTFTASCSSYKNYAPGKYLASCNHISTDESCLRDAYEYCPNGYRIILRKNEWATQSKKYIAIMCNK
jgi:hypothetical protein